MVSVGLVGTDKGSDFGEPDSLNHKICSDPVSARWTCGAACGTLICLFDDLESGSGCTSCSVDEAAIPATVSERACSFVHETISTPASQNETGCMIFHDSQNAHG